MAKEQEIGESGRLLAGRLNPKNDFLFKRLFGEEEGKPLLISLLNAVLRRGDQRRITGVSIADDTHLGREMMGDKEIVFDILCEIDGREKVDVEMQVRRFARMDYRSLYDLATMLADAIHRGATYSNLKRSIGVHLLDHEYFPLPKFHNTFHLYEDEDRVRYSRSAASLVAVFGAKDDNRTIEGADGGG